MVSGDVNSDVMLKTLQNLGTTTYQKTCIFHLILLGIPSSLVLSIKNRGMGGGG